MQVSNDLIEEVHLPNCIFIYWKRGIVPKHSYIIYLMVMEISYTQGNTTTCL